MWARAASSKAIVGETPAVFLLDPQTKVGAPVRGSADATDARSAAEARMDRITAGASFLSNPALKLGRSFACAADAARSAIDREDKTRKVRFITISLRRKDAVPLLTRLRARVEGPARGLQRNRKPTEK